MGRALLALLAAALALPAGAAAQPCPVPLPICQDPEPEPTPERPPQAPPPPPTSSVEGSATAGVDAAHTGYFADPTLAPPLERRWHRSAEYGWDPPLYGQGRIYASASGRLHAIDPQTGRDVWTVAVTGRAGAYDEGRIFMLDGGNLRAHSAADGQLLWSAALDINRAGVFPPVATGGTVYVGSFTISVTAVDAATGAIRWRSTDGGLSTPPAVDQDRVYGFTRCQSAQAWNRADGAPLWTTPTPGCESGARRGDMAAVHRGRVYATGNSTVHDAATGATVGRYDGGISLFAGDIGVFGSEHLLKAVDLDDGRQIWKERFDDPWRAGVISGSTVYTAGTGVLRGIDLRTGTEMWSAAVSGQTAEGYRDPALGVAPGLLLAATGRQLSAWQGVFNPGPDGIEIGPRVTHVTTGARSVINGVVGTNLRAGRVTLEYDQAPYGRWRALTHGRAAEDGWVGFRVRVDRNTRLRVRAGGRASNVLSFYVYPKARIRIRALGPRLRTTASLHHPPDIRLGGRRAVLYLGRRALKRYVRLGTTVVRRTGRSASRAVFVHGVPKGARRTDYLTVCIKGQARIGLGQNAGLLRRCGRRSIRF